MPSKNLLPGILNDDLEMFFEQDQLHIIHSGKVFNFSQLPYLIVSKIEEEINKDQNVINALNIMHPLSKIKRTEQYAICRFGGLDFNSDINSDKFQDGEYWTCPKHGNCPHEGILCKLPIINGIRLNKMQVKIMKFISSDAINEVIAEELLLPMGTYNKLKKELYSLLGIQTKQEVSNICRNYNLI